MRIPTPPDYRSGLFLRNSDGKLVLDNTGQPIINRPWMNYFNDMFLAALNAADIEAMVAFQPAPAQDPEQRAADVAAITQQGAQRIDRQELEEIRLSAELSVSPSFCNAAIDEVRLVAETQESGIGVIWDRLSEIESLVAMIREDNPGVSELLFSQGTYANRPTVFKEKQIYYASDQTIFYMVLSGAWVYVCGVIYCAAASLPALAAGDVGALAYTSDNLDFCRWSGGAWAIILSDRIEQMVRSESAARGSPVSGHPTMRDGEMMFEKNTDDSSKMYLWHRKGSSYYYFIEDGSV